MLLENYSTNDLDELVFQSQEGNEESTLEILRRFGYVSPTLYINYLGKWYDILWKGAANLRDKETRRFISLYSNDKVFHRRIKNRERGRNTNQDAHSLISYISNSCQVLGAEEIRSALVMILIKKINDYKKTREKVNFAGYLYNSFYFEIYRYLARTVFRQKDIMDHPKFFEDKYNEELIESSYQNTFIPGTLLEEEKSQKIDIFWVNGDCHEIFKVLNNYQRNLIKMHYYDGLYDKEIGEMLGRHINTIFLARSKAKKILEEEVDLWSVNGGIDLNA